MKITKLHIKNFRLLKDVELSLEEKSTVIVGRNNSGKTSLTEIFRRLLSDRTPSFTIYDFNTSCISAFEQALSLWLVDAEENAIRAALPVIQIKFIIKYNPDVTDLGVLGDFIIDLDPACTDVVIIVNYQLQNGKIENLFEGIVDESEVSVKQFVKNLHESVTQLYETTVLAQDPNDISNVATIEYSKFRQLMAAGFINAQRGLDDITHTEKDVLGKVLAKLFKTANSANAPQDLREKSEALDVVLKEIQDKVDTDFNEKLDELLPALRIFGYPGLADPQLSTETTLNVANILDSHTKIRYSQGGDMYLPESYNGLGSRNLIYILFHLFEFFRDWQSKPIANSLHIVFIEEPEAHLHPQMQQVFITQLNEIANEFSRTLNSGVLWPVQFIVTTHSTHIANEAKFESIRYFLTTRVGQKETKIKDLRKEFTDPGVQQDKEFLHKYLTLTKCDLFFADKAILIEGPTERILMPVLMEKADSLITTPPKLTGQYISVIEIGGAYAHHFYKFLDFLELRTLVITDLDSVLPETKKSKTVYSGYEVAKCSHSSNAGIRNWFAQGSTGHIKLQDFKDKLPAEKISGFRRIAFQIPESGKTCCGRSFEDAMMLANPTLFGLIGNTDAEKATDAFSKVPQNNEKTEFALHYALEELNWTPPHYIVEGLSWLALHPNTLAAVIQTVAATETN